jgi:2-hydroxychromene-2-carboxylate isomerase
MGIGYESVFLYDFNSPYAYLAAARIDDLMPGEVRWQPVALAFMLRAHDRRPWSFDEQQREAGVAECERRARAYGLPEMRWPPGWPIESYGLASLRGALVAADHGLLRAFSAAAFRRAFVDGLGLKHTSDVLKVADEIGLDRTAVEAGLEAPDVKARLTEATQAAISAGVIGVPTVVVGGRLFWGDDQLEEAAAARAGPVVP